MTLHPLEGFPIVQSASPGSLRDAVDRLTNYGHSVIRETNQPLYTRGVVNGLRLSDVSLVYVAYATPVSVLAPPTKGQIMLVIPLGPMRVETGSGAETLTTPFVLSAGTETTMIPDHKAGALVGSVSIEALLDMLSESFGEGREFALNLRAKKPIPIVSQTFFKRTWLEFSVDPEGGDPADLLDALAIGLVPYTSYKQPEMAEWQKPPEYLIAAVRHLRRNYADPLSMADLSARIGIGSRQLQLAFKAHLGCTAQDYLKKVRLEHALAILRQSGSGKTIAEIGAEVGLPHQGRFGQYFKERFGSLPSEFQFQI